MSSLDSQMESVVSRAREAFNAGKLHTYEQRMQYLKSIDTFLVEQEQAIVDALHADLGKPTTESLLWEVQICRSEIALAQNNLRSWMATKPASRTFVYHLAGDSAGLKPEPYGVVTVIAPWNYPIYLTLMPVVGAIAAGNCVVIKPSEVSENCSNLYRDVFTKYLPQDCFPVVTGGIPETTALLRQRVDYIFYTGSTFVGRVVMKAAAEHLTPVTLELGGKCPVYLDERSDIEMMADRVVSAKCMNAGQICVCIDYILCTREVQDRLIAAMKKALHKFFGDNMQKSSCYGRIVNDRHFQRLTSMLDSSNGTVAIDMGSDRADRFMGLKVLSDVSADDSVMKDEIFGPILPIVPIRDADEAIQFIRSKEKPLAAYVYSPDTATVEKFAEFTSSGALVANDAMAHLPLASLPFGGVGQSGIGSYHGKASFDTFSHHKSILVRHQNMEFLNKLLRYPPYSDAGSNLLRHSLYRTPDEGILLYLKALVMATLALLGLTATTFRSRH
eukprot:scpid68133/ scgid6040/ Aldehyde dehydrogenase family 3 member B1